MLNSVISQVLNKATISVFSFVNQEIVFDTFNSQLEQLHKTTNENIRHKLSD